MTCREVHIRENVVWKEQRREEEEARIATGGHVGAGAGLYPSLPDRSEKANSKGAIIGKGDKQRWGGKYSRMNPGGWYQRGGAGK